MQAGMTNKERFLGVTTSSDQAGVLAIEQCRCQPARQCALPRSDSMSFLWSVWKIEKRQEPTLPLYAVSPAFTGKTRASRRDLDRRAALCGGRQLSLIARPTRGEAAHLGTHVRHRPSTPTV